MVQMHNDAGSGLGLGLHLLQRAGRDKHVSRQSTPKSPRFRSGGTVRKARPMEAPSRHREQPGQSGATSSSENDTAIAPLPQRLQQIGSNCFTSAFQ